ncbi:acetyl-CoA carboxylase biotin carboxyl carrier protein [Frankia sp. AgKG'84/4]
MITDQATRTATNGAHPAPAAIDPAPAAIDPAPVAIDPAPAAIDAATPPTPAPRSVPALTGTLPAVDAIVGVLSAHLLELAVRAPAAPSLVRLSAGDVTVEMGWSTAAPSYGDAAPARTRWTTSAGVPPTAQPSVEAGAAPALTAAPGAPSANGAAAVNGAAPGATAEAGTFTVGSPSVGVFYRAAEPGKAPFVTEGDVVRAGQQVGIVEAMKLMIPIEADRAGRIVRILAEDTAPIEHDQPLFVLAPVDGDS